MSALSVGRTGNTYYPTTVQGTVAAIIFDAQYKNTRAIRALVETAIKQFEAVTGIIPTGGEDFCQMVEERQEHLTITDILSSAFFQNMLALEPSPHHNKVETLIAPRMLDAARRHFADAVIQPMEEEALLRWYIRFAEGVLPEQQIVAYEEPQGEEAEAVMNERKAIGRGIFTAAQAKTLDEDGLRVIIGILQGATEGTQQLKEGVAPVVSQLVGRYLTLIGKVPQPAALARDIATQLQANIAQIFPPL